MNSLTVDTPKPYKLSSTITDRNQKSKNQKKQNQQKLKSFKLQLMIPRQDQHMRNLLFVRLI